MTLLYVSRDGVALDEGDVRATTGNINPDEPSAVASQSPDYNYIERDPDTNGGLTTRAVADKVNPSEQYLPLVGNANTDFSAPIDTQVSTSGTAAAREMRGEWGHGSGYYQEAIEPIIRPGTEFNDTYFRAERPPIQDGTIDYMTAPRRPDSGIAAGDMAAAARASREATANLYQAFLEGR